MTALSLFRTRPKTFFISINANTFFVTTSFFCSLKSKTTSLLCISMDTDVFKNDHILGHVATKCINFFDFITLMKNYDGNGLGTLFLLDRTTLPIISCLYFYGPSVQRPGSNVRNI